jgi:hypothetical protein
VNSTYPAFSSKHGYSGVSDGFIGKIIAGNIALLPGKPIIGVCRNFFKTTKCEKGSTGLAGNPVGVKQVCFKRNLFEN